MEFEIGLAYKTGNLTGRGQSRVQRWALGYYQYSERRDSQEQFDEIRKVLHFILRGTNSKLYELAYPNIVVDDPDVVPGHTYGVDDLEGLEGLIKHLDGMKTRSQASLNKSEWTEWR